MKAGETAYLKIKINNLKIGVVRSVVFTLKSQQNAITKTYPDNVTFDGDYFMVGLNQQETTDLAGYYMLEAQVNYVDKSVSKTEGKRGYVEDTVATLFLTGNEPQNVSEQMALSVSEVQIVHEGGGGGSSDYRDLDNKPLINGTVLVGNKTFEELGLDEEVDSYIEAHKDELKGADGYTPKKGVDYSDGADGFSPSAKVERVTYGAKITITDKSGTTEAEVFDGEGGSSGLSPAIAQAIYNLLTDAVYLTDNHSADFAIIKALDGGVEPEPEPEPEPSEPTLVSISATNSYSEFIVGQPFNVGGIVVTAHYSDETSKVVDGWEASNVDTSTVGDKPCTITYTEDGYTKTTVITIKVVEDSPTPTPLPTTYTVVEGDQAKLAIGCNLEDGVCWWTDIEISTNNLLVKSGNKVTVKFNHSSSTGAGVYYSNSSGGYIFKNTEKTSGGMSGTEYTSETGYYKFQYTSSWVGAIFESEDGIEIIKP